MTHVFMVPLRFPIFTRQLKQISCFDYPIKCKKKFLPDKMSFKPLTKRDF
jgi:hypothetical protein